MTTTTTALFRGNKADSISKIEAQNLNTIAITNKPTLEFINLSDLIPLETQRYAKDTWVQKRLKDRNGLDQVAFGALTIARTPEGKNLVADGNGRYNLAEHAGWTDNIPCIVWKLTKQQAAFYFNYTQKTGRRNLSPEVLYVNSYLAGDTAASLLHAVMERIDVYIQGDTNYAVPHPKQSNAVEVKYRTVDEAYNKMCGWNDSSERIRIMRIARDMITQAFPGENMLQQDLFWATYYILSSVPKTQSGATNNKFQDFLIGSGLNNTQAQFTKTWKVINSGTSGNSSKVKSLAEELLKCWKLSKNAPRDITYAELDV